MNSPKGQNRTVSGPYEGLSGAGTHCGCALWDRTVQRKERGNVCRLLFLSEGFPQGIARAPRTVCRLAHRARHRPNPFGPNALFGPLVFKKIFSEPDSGSPVGRRKHCVCGTSKTQKPAETVDFPWFIRRTPRVLPQLQYRLYHMSVNRGNKPPYHITKHTG